MSLDYDIEGIEEYGPEDSVKIDGPPGTGKSTQIQLRTEKFLKETNSTTSDICLVTYRKSLAEDIIQRFKDEDLVPPTFNPRRSNIGTLHAICNRLIRSQTDIDISNKVDEFVKHLFCQEYGLEYYGDHKGDLTGGKQLFRVFSWMLANKEPPESIPQEMYDDVAEACGKNVDIRYLWEQYKDFKENPPTGKLKSLDKGDELFDFDELLLIAREQRLVPDVDMVIVDEMHDFYPAMFDLIKMWMEELEDATFIVAGDKHQVINQYRGATPEFYKQIDLPEISLPTSYRCPESHLDYSHNILSSYYPTPDVNSEDENGFITEVSGAQMKYEARNDEWRIPISSNTPADLYEEYVKDDESAMFLVRTNHQAKAIAESLTYEGIAFTSNSVEDWRDIGLVDVYNALCKCLEVPSDPSYTYEGGLGIDVEDSLEIDSDSLVELIDVVPAKFIRDTKYDALGVIDDLEQYKVRNLHNVFTDDFFEEIHSNPIQMLLSSINKTKLARLSNRHDWEPIHEDGIDVQILTIHASKGMEADTVFLYDGISNRIRESIQNSKRSDRNECRVWYVASTRANKNLVVVRGSFQGYESSPYLPPVKDSYNGSGNA